MDALQRSGASGLSHARALNAADVGATEVAVDTSCALSLKLYWFCTLLNLGALLRAALQVLRAAETCCYLLLLWFSAPFPPTVFVGVFLWMQEEDRFLRMQEEDRECFSSNSKAS
jgi:hypothetical protein